jgi:hypothetical protein
MVAHIYDPDSEAVGGGSLTYTGDPVSYLNLIFASLCDKVLLCSPGCPQILGPPFLDSGVLRLQACHQLFFKEWTLTLFI